MNVVQRWGSYAFRVNPADDGLDEEALDKINRAVLARMFWDDPAFMSSTLLHGTFALRMCIINHTTTRTYGANILILSFAFFLLILQLAAESAPDSAPAATSSRRNVDGERFASTNAASMRSSPASPPIDVRDRDLKGFGVRVLPSGAKRYFVHSQHQGRRVWTIVGHAGAIGVHEARDRARTLLASIRDGSGDEAAAPPDIDFEAVAEEVFRRYARNWKPSTLKVNRGYYRKQILPWFEGRPIAGITAADVRRWFASLHETPVAADRSAPVLSVIMRQAEVYGYRPEGTNPCAGIRRYRRRGRERFLSAAEIRRLGEVLARHESDHPQAVAIIRLLLLTGCRRSEIVTLKWRYYREGKLFLPDEQVWPANGLALVCRARDPRRLAPQGGLDLSFAPQG